jgi:autotransporter-associated beta strand protein
LLSFQNAVNLAGHGLTIAGTGNTTVAGPIGGVGALNKIGSGTLILSGANTYTGATTITSGTLQIGAGGTTGSFGTGSVTNHGTLLFNRSDAIAVPQAISGTGAVRKSAGGTLTLSGANLYTGVTTIDGGIVNVSGNQSGANGGWSIGPTSTITTTVNVQAGSTMVVASGKQIRLGNTTAAGTTVQTLNVAGTVINHGTLYNGRPGVLNLNPGGSWTQNGAMSLIAHGGYSSTTTVNAGGSFIYAGSNMINLEPAAGNSGNAVLTISGGTFTTQRGFLSTGAASMSTTSGIHLSDGGTLRLSANIPALLSATNNTLVFRIGTGGGVLDTQGFVATLGPPVADVTGQTGTFTKTGSGSLILIGAGTHTGGTTIADGTLQLGNGGSTGSLGAGSILNQGTLTVQRATGLSISSAISGTGSFVQAGTGTTTLAGANTYSGDTTVSAGTLFVTSPFFADSSSVRLSTGARLNLAHSSTDVIERLYFNGQLQVAGVWGAVGSGAEHESALINGTGRIQATQGAIPFETWVASFGLSGTNAALDADPDDDGAPNLLEFALNGDPTSGTSSGLAFASIQPIAGQDFLTYTIAVRTGATFSELENRQIANRDGLTYLVEATLDLNDWEISEAITEIVPALTAGLPAPSLGWEYHTFRTNGDPATTPPTFLRVRVEAP